jgi:hypothetical protein
MGDKPKLEYRFLATGIGSVPYRDVEGTCRMILDRFPGIPFWPQFPKRSFLEGMIVQYSEGLPLLELDQENGGLRLSNRDRAAELTCFYERFLADDTAHFAISSDFAPGLHEMMALLLDGTDDYGKYVKGHTVGPVTFCTSIRDAEGRALIHDPEGLEALSKGLAIKALWQVKELSTLGRRVVLFLDEPSLSGFGSAFSPVSREEVIRLLKEFMAYLRERCTVTIGIHCCGNTDWSMIAEAGPDIINFDAYTYLDTFLLYREQISRFVSAGGSIAWGIVPTGEQAGQASPEDLLKRMREGLDRLSGTGLGRDPEEIRRCSLLTPACGMGNMAEAATTKALDLLKEVSRRCAAEV